MEVNAYSQKMMEAYKNSTYKIMGHKYTTTNLLIEAMNAMGKDQEKDVYGTGKLITDFQEKIAEKLNMEEAVFFPSGTMAQQIALRMWCDQRQVKTVAYHPLCHLEIHEEGGLKELHHIKTILLGDKDRLFTLADLKEVKEKLGAVLIELPQREIGGQLPSFSELEEISAYCREQNIPLHLDGARLFETLPYYEKEASEIAQLFDSVYISFYKGFGGITGAMLAGTSDFCKQSKVWKRRHGGDLYALYPYIISSDYCYELRKDKMKLYYEKAKILAREFNQCQHIKTLPEIPVSNMFHVHINLAKDLVEKILTEVYEVTDVAIRANVFGDNRKCYFEFSVGDGALETPDKDLNDMFKKLEKLVSLY